MLETSNSETTPAAPSKLQVFFVRLRSTLFLWALIGSALILRSEGMMMGLVAFFGFLTTIEYLRLDKDDVEGRFYRRSAWMVTLVYWGLVLWQTLTTHAAHAWWLDMALPVVALQAAFCITLGGSLQDRDTLFRIHNSVFAVVYTTFMFGFMARLLYFNGLPGGMNHMLLVIAVTKFTDMGAYVVGSLCGRHKMIPRISPAKTWEGLAGAFLFGYLAMFIVMYFGAAYLKPLTWGHAMLLAPCISLAAVVGDLAESVLKRCHHIKDAGHKLPGIGGILDLTDSLLFTAPVTYFYLQAIA
jgi:phosphatidate cytidylyltransferase